MKRVAMIFPDYGSQYVGMAKELYDSSRVMQEYFDEASNCLGINFIKLCFASSEHDLFKIEHAYTALFLISTALAALLKEQGVNPSIVAGYGIGELSAIHVAGGISLPDGLYLLNKYASFFLELIKNNDMQVARIEHLKTLSLKKLCASLNTTIAGYIHPTMHIVSGTATSMQLIKQEVHALGGSFESLRTQVGFHSLCMLPIAQELKKYLTKVDFKSTPIDVAMNVDGQIIQQGDFIRRRLIKQLYNPVRWDKIMKLMDAYDVIIEVGPGSTLSKIAEVYYPDKTIFSFCKKSDMTILNNMLPL